MAEIRSRLSAFDTTFRTPTFWASTSTCGDQCMVCISMGISGRSLEIWPSRGQAIHDRHDQVENDEIGLEFLGLGDGFLAILDVDDLPGASAFEQSVQGSSHRRIVFGNQYSGRHAIAKQIETADRRSCFSAQCLMPYEITMKSPLEIQEILYNLPYVTGRFQTFSEKMCNIPRASNCSFPIRHERVCATRRKLCAKQIELL